MDNSSDLLIWRHDDRTCQWILSHGVTGEKIGSITDEALPPADQWDDKPPLSPGLPVREGFHNFVTRTFGVALPREARPGG